MNKSRSKRSQKLLKCTKKIDRSELRISLSGDNKKTITENLDSDNQDVSGSVSRPKRLRKQKNFDGYVTPKGLDNSITDEYVTPKGLDNSTTDSPAASHKKKSSKAFVTSTPVSKRSHQNINNSANTSALEGGVDKSILKPHVSGRRGSPTKFQRRTSYGGDASNSLLVLANLNVVNSTLGDESLTSDITLDITSDITLDKSEKNSQVVTPPNKRRKITSGGVVGLSKKTVRGRSKEVDVTPTSISAPRENDSEADTPRFRTSARARKNINYLDLCDNEDIRTSEEDVSMNGRNKKSTSHLSRSGVKALQPKFLQEDTTEKCLETEKTSIGEESKISFDKNSSQVTDKPRRGRKRKKVQEAEETKETDGVLDAYSPCVPTCSSGSRKNPTSVDHQAANHVTESEEELGFRRSRVKKCQGQKLSKHNSKTLLDTNKPSSSTTRTESSSLQCGICSMTFNSQALLKKHMMPAHSLVWSASNPQGEDKPAVIIKLLGYIICQGCQKQFRFPQYYKHHMNWCGREDEMVICEICTHSVKAQWYDRHLASHKLKEKQTALKEEKKQKISEDAGPSDQEDNGRRSKRSAAKSAMKFISEFHKTKGSENEFSDKSDKSITSESSDDSEDDNKDEFIDGSDEDHTERPQKNDSVRIADPSSIDGKWGSICLMDKDTKEEDRLKALHTFFTGLSLGGRLFPELSPQVNNWVLLKDRDREKYLPHRRKSFSFTAGPSNKPPDMNMTSLEWGQAKVIDGKSYSYCGGPIWSLEWCPLPEGAEQEQIVALSADIGPDKPPDTSATHAGSGLVQIWSTGAIKNDKESSADLSLQYCVAHDSGYVVSMSWCPHRCFDQEDVKDNCFLRLGILAVACSDGSVLVYSLPQAQSLQLLMSSMQDSTVPGENSTVPIYHTKASLTLRPNLQSSCGPCLCTSWQQGGELRYIIAGYAQGCTLLWDLLSSSPLIRVNSSTLRPMQCFRYNTDSILACTWNPRSPTIFLTSSFDGCSCQWDTRIQSMPIAIFKQPHKFFIQHSLCWAGPLINGFFSCSEKFDYTENCPVSFHGLARAALRNMATGILVQSHSACVWDVCFSPFYEVLASCDATGKVKVTLPQMVGLRTKTIKSQISWHTRTCPSMVLYQARLAEETPAGQGPSANVTQQCEGHLQNTESVIPGQGHEPDLSSETESNQPANHINKEEFQLSTLTNNLHLENSKNLNKTETNQILTGHTKPTSAKKSGSSTKVPGLACSESCPNSEDTLHYVETRPELKLSAKVSGKVEHEVYGGSNIQAVHRVRFSPNVNCCLWLASGGEAGILRLHNLTSVVRPSKAKAHQFYEKHRKGKNS